MGRLLRRIAIGLLALVVTALIGGWLVLPGIVAQVIEASLEEAGVVDPQVTGVSVGLDRLQVERIAGADARAPAIEGLVVTYTLAGLMDGRVIGVNAARVTAAVDVAADGAVTIPGVGAPEGEGGGAARLPALPVDRVAVTALVLDITADGQAARLDVQDVVAAPTDGGLAVTLDFRASHDLAAIEGRFEAQVADDLSTLGSLAIVEGRAETAPLATDRLEAALDFAWQPGAAPRLEGDLTLDGPIIAGQAFDRLALTYDLSRAGYRAGLDATAANGQQSITADIDLPVDGRGAVSLSADIDLASDLPIDLAISGVGDVTGGRLAVGLEATSDGVDAAAFARHPLAALAALDVAGRVEVGIDGLDVSGLVDGAALAMDADWSFRDRTLTATATGPWRASGRLGGQFGQPSPGIDEAAGRRSIGIDIVTGPEGTGAASASIAFDAEWAPADIGLRGNFSVDAQVDGISDQPLAITVEGVAADLLNGRIGVGAIALSESLAIPGVQPSLGVSLSIAEMQIDNYQSYRIDEISLETGAFLTAGVAFERVTFEGGGSGDLTGDRVLTGDLALDLGGALPGVREVRDGTIRTVTEIAYRDGDILVTPDGCVVLDFARAEAAGTVIDQQRDWCLALPSPIQFDPATGYTRVAVASDARPISGTVPGPAGPVRFTGRLPPLAIEAGLVEEGSRVTVTGRGGRIDLPDLDIALDRIDPAVTLTGPALSQLIASIRIGEARHTVDTPALVPMRLDLGISGRVGGRLTVDATAQDASGSVVISSQARHNPVSGAGDADFKLHDVQLLPEIRELASIAPISAQFAEGVTGTIGATGTAAWDAASFNASGQLLLDGVSFAQEAFAVSGLSTVLTASSLTPLVLPPGQVVSIGTVEAVFPLEGGVIRFGIPDGRSVAIEAARLGWSGGTLSTDPFTAPLDGSGGAFVFRADDIDVGRLFEEFLIVEGLAGTGTLQGELPIEIADGSVSVVGGFLETSEPGVIRYDPDEPPAFLTANDQTRLVAQALANFNYNVFRMEIDGVLGEDNQLVRLELDGANPDLYDGQLIDLNVNVTGPLEAVVRQQLSTFQGQPEAVRELIRDYRERQR